MGGFMRDPEYGAGVLECWSRLSEALFFHFHEAKWIPPSASWGGVVLPRIHAVVRHRDTVPGLAGIQTRPRRFNVGPVLKQETICLLTSLWVSWKRCQGQVPICLFHFWKFCLRVGTVEGSSYGSSTWVSCRSYGWVYYTYISGLGWSYQSCWY